MYSIVSASSHLIWYVLCFQRSDKHLPLNTLQMHGPARRLCCARPRIVHVIFRLPLASYAASGATLSASYFFLLDCVCSRLLQCLRCFWAANDYFFLLFCFNFFFLHEFTILCFIGFAHTVSPRSHYCAWGRAIQRPRTRSAAARQVSNAHERDLVTYNNVYFRPF